MFEGIYWWECNFEWCFSSAGLTASELGTQQSSEHLEALNVSLCNKQRWRPRGRSWAWRTDFEVLGLEGQVLGLGLEASSPGKLACPRLEDSSIFWIVKILWSAWKIFWKTFFCGDRLKNFCEFEDRLKNFCEDFFFFGEHLRLCPWSVALASRVSVLGKAVLGLGFFLCRWPWPRALCPRLHLWQ